MYLKFKRTLTASTMGLRYTR